jgi:LasA protease
MDGYKDRLPGKRWIWLIFPLLVVIGTGLACQRNNNQAIAPWSVSKKGGTQIPVTPTSMVFSPVIRDPGAPILTPTADKPHILPTQRTEPEAYSVQSGDTLGIIAQKYQISLDDLIQANELVNPNLLSVGQVLTVPVPLPGTPGLDFKVIPDSELVYGPLSADFDIGAFIREQGGYLQRHEEEVEGQLLSGIEIVSRVAREFSVNPRLLLAVLEYQSGWVTQKEVAEERINFPLGFSDTWHEGLYLQLAWAANQLNRGYYLWRVNGVGTWNTADNSVIPISPLINAGTAGIQSFFAPLYTRSGWEKAVSEEGLYKTYHQFFGYPFDLAVEPVVPNSLMQPIMQLPFEPGLDWAFTGGPHGSWGDGSAWGAIDFAPPGEALGCVTSNAWVVAVADGQILRVENGAVIQDLDGDGLEQTGWVVLYMHIESRDRVNAGVTIQAGERIGHPSCEGGFSTGTHVHLARKYNGEWIAADQTVPFVLDGWISRGSGNEYDGFLMKEGHVVEAWEGYFPENTIRKEP